MTRTFITDEAPLQVAQFAKNSREELRFSLSTYRGHRLVSARVWAQKPDGTVIPTKSGLSLRIDLLSDVRKALELVAQAAEEAGWISPVKGGDGHA